MVKKSVQSDNPNQHLKQQREARGWSQKYVAQNVGTSAFTVGRWERGVNRPSSYFRAKLRDLFQRNDEELGFSTHQKTTVDGPHLPLAGQQAIESDAHSQSLLPMYDLAISSLPAQTKGLVGRDDLLQRLKTRLLTQQSLALSALKGLPGVGKTALAKQIAHDADIQAHFQHGILWVGIGQHPNILALLSNWGALLSIAPSEIATLTHATAWANILRAMIGERSLLIVLDDVWKIEDALALKVGGPNCAYLLTTRFPQLAVQFAVEHAEIVYELNEDDSVQLLARFASNVVAQEPELARALVRASGGLPLALTIMGRYLQFHAHSDQPRRIKAALERLQDVKERLRLTQNIPTVEHSSEFPIDISFSLQAVIALSDQQLTQEAKPALRALALLAPKPNTFSEEAALAVTNSTVEMLDTLSDAGLLEASVPDRYTLHQTIADYARLEEPDRRAEQRLVFYGEDFTMKYQQDYVSLEQGAINLLTALQLAEKHKMHESFILIVLNLASFWEARGLYTFAETHLERALGYAKALVLPRPPRPSTFHKDALWASQSIMRASLWLALGRIAERRGALELAEQHYEAGMLLARQLENKEMMSRLLANRGETALNRGNFDDAIRFAQEGLLLARAIDNQWRITALLKILGEAVDCLGEFKRGDQLYMEGLTLARKIGDWETMCTLLQNLGAKAIKRGEYALARVYVQEGFDKARAMEHRQRMSALLMLMGVIAIRAEDYIQANVYYQESLHLARRIGHRVRLSNVLQNLGMLESLLKHYAASDTYFQESLTIARDVGHRWLIGETLDEWGEARLGRGDWLQAKALFSEALALTQTIVTPELIAHALFGLGRIDAHEGHYAEAWHKGRQALEIFAAERHERMNDVIQWFNTLPEE